jgi:hypothetical protein
MIGGVTHKRIARMPLAGGASVPTVAPATLPNDLFLAQLYTVAGDSHLYYRYFTPESDVVGALTFQANANNVNCSQVAGMTLAGGQILYGSNDGRLRTVPFDGTQVTSPTPVVRSNDGSWKLRAILVPNG